MADTIRQLLGLSATITRSDTALLDCQLILAHLLGKPRSWLLAYDDFVPSDHICAAYREMLSRRQQGEPVAYLLGYKDFWNSRLRVTPATLVPRPETELLVEVALAAPVGNSPVVLDLGTGSGAIAISLATERPDWHVIASDNSAMALAVAAENARSLTNLTLLRGHWGEAVDDASIDMVVCNPPYIREDDPHLAGLLREPSSALTSGASGMCDIFQVINACVRILRPGGKLILEHGFDQRCDVLSILQCAGFEAIETFDDTNRLPRAIKATRP
jgi:release factor glutamine methyltransferase